jgi:hypothetical protein
MKLDYPVTRHAPGTEPGNDTPCHSLANDNETRESMKRILDYPVNPGNDTTFVIPSR